MFTPTALLYLALVVAVLYWVWASIVATPDQPTTPTPEREDHDA